MPHRNTAKVGANVIEHVGPTQRLDDHRLARGNSMYARPRGEVRWRERHVFVPCKRRQQGTVDRHIGAVVRCKNHNPVAQVVQDVFRTVADARKRYIVTQVVDPDARFGVATPDFDVRGTNEPQTARSNRVLEPHLRGRQCGRIQRGAAVHVEHLDIGSFMCKSCNCPGSRPANREIEQPARTVSAGRWHGRVTVVAVGLHDHAACRYDALYHIACR